MIIVTGGAGFLGSGLVWGLNAAGYDDILVVDNLGHGDKWKNLVNRRFADYLHKDAFLEAIAEAKDPFGATSVIHLGACSATTETDAEYLMRNNTAYTKAVARYALEAGARLVVASSAATYGDGSLGFDDDPGGLGALKPLNMYGYSKHLFDLWARREGLLGQLASLKFFNVYGPNEYHKADMRSVVCKAYAQIGKTGRLSLFKSSRADYPDGGQKRDFLYVKDAVAVMLWLLEHPEVGGVYNVGSGAARTWNDLAAAVFSAMGKALAVDYIPMPEAIRGKYQYFTEAKMDRLHAAGCANSFMTLEEGVADYVKGYLSQPDRYL
ncbi:ADP-glyceromanno-heptose 6-epimerase [Solidesulfovibrio magneticus]|uniref:ADP-L-glycero-D-manno-heptose-6-epimerase n=1 Tax=Solidesulfovibrio magneticus (strain ATCC 700980 / DSM 13731 / RS-1) TaxID=573370 RepID=C4XS75_SOLM1|nr:ADP-glyceromanno-heptose 6-epimerase [Solidesulfovibrio magneticus]BAH75597.1 ADP-L-glycero-D-manno-heptose-6-epimerase [Solidesulfovibrio magneticus RS-1]